MKIRYVIPLFAIVGAVFGSDLKKEELSGLRLSLVHETKIETYRLGKNGVALAQFGTKSGPIAGPALQWKLEGGYLVITDGKNVKQRFEIVEKSEKSLKLRRQDGEVAVF